MWMQTLRSDVRILNRMNTLMCGSIKASKKTAKESFFILKMGYAEYR
jgi:hypothetical protein